MTVRAILTPPQERAFRELCEVEDSLEVHVHGWSKHVILSSDRVFLFPRDHTRSPNLDREASALGALEACALVPTLLAHRQDDRISPYAFLEVERVPGSPFYGEVYEAAELHSVLELMTQLGAAIAGYHQRSTRNLPPNLEEPLQRPHDLLERALRDDPSFVVAEAASALETPAEDSWAAAIDAVRSLSPVLTHGDVHGEQLMTEHRAITGIVDWETAAVDNPIRDFTFREWGRGWYRAHEPDFALLRERLWASYVDARRESPLPDWATVHLFLSFIDAWQCAIGSTPFDIERRPRTLRILQAATTARP